METNTTRQQVLNKLNSRAVLILRGLPGAGKSSFIDLLEDHLNTPNPNALAVVSSNHYFVRESDGEYIFNKHLLGQAHASCKENFTYFAEKRSFKRPLFLVVDNTNLNNKEFDWYVSEAHKNQWDVIFITFEVDPEVSFNRNIHGVPKSTIDKMSNKIKKFTLPDNCLHYIVSHNL